MIGGGFGVALPVVIAFAGLLPAASRPKQLPLLRVSLAAYYGLLWLQGIYNYPATAVIPQGIMFTKLIEIGIISAGVTCLSLLGIVASRYQRNRIDVLNQSLEKSNQQLLSALAEVKDLRGILPICANCKQIRDDSGLYHEIEVYISHHTDVDFSHTVCKPCQKILYPEFVRD